MVRVLSRLTVESQPTIPGARLKFRFIPLALFLMNLTMFTLVNFSHNNYLAGFIGLPVIIACSALIILAARKNRRPKPAQETRKTPETRPDPAFSGRE
jgi:hypothetical protein